MADDHLNVAVHSNGTMYVAAKTSYSGSPKMILLVRRPNGTWDNMYSVDGERHAAHRGARRNGKSHRRGLYDQRQWR